MSHRHYVTFTLAYVNMLCDCRDSESFELFFPARLDKIIHEANEYEKKLENQKEQLAQRLKTLSETLRRTEALSQPDHTKVAATDNHDLN